MTTTQTEAIYITEGNLLVRHSGIREVATVTDSAPGRLAIRFTDGGSMGVSVYTFVEVLV